MANNTPGSERPWLEAARRKPKRRLTKKMVKYAENRAAGMRPIDAAKVAEYKSPQRAAQFLESSDSMTRWNREMMELSGVTPKRIFDKLSEKLDAKRSVYVLIQDERDFEHPADTREGEEERRRRGREPKKTLIEEDDNHAQHKFLETAIQMGVLRPEIQQRMIIEGQVDISVAHTHLVVPVVPQDMVQMWDTMTSEDKAKALTDRARKRLTGTLMEDPVDLNAPHSDQLKPLTAKVADMPKAETVEED